MERLTRNLHPIYVLTEEMEKEYIDDKIKKLTNKLGKYEDLEEQIGCPLDVLFKALKNGFFSYVKGADTDDYWARGEFILEYDSWKEDYCFRSITKNGSLGHTRFWAKDHKKTWRL